MDKINNAANYVSESVKGMSPPAILFPSALSAPLPPIASIYARFPRSVSLYPQD